MALKIGGGLQGPEDMRLNVGNGPLLGGGGSGGPISWRAEAPHVFAISNLFKEYEVLVDTIDQRTVTDFMIKTEKQLAADYDDPDTGQFTTRKGAAAKGMLQEYRDWTRTWWDEESSKDLNDRQRGQAASLMAKLFLGRAQQIAGHEAKSLHQDAVQRNELAINDTMNLIASGNMSPERLEPLFARLQDSMATMGRMQGWSPEYTDMQFNEKFGAALVKGAEALAEKNAPGALGMLRAYKEEIPAAMFSAAEGKLRDKAKAQAAEWRVQAEKQHIDETYAALESMPPSQAIAYVTSPEGREALGLNGEQSLKVAGMLHTRDTYLKQAEKAAREAANTQVLTDAVNVAMGVNGQTPDPVAAYSMVQADPSLDGKTRLDTLKALENGILNRDDPATNTDFISRIARADSGEPPVSDAELAQAVAAGRLSFAGRDRLAKLRDDTAGPEGQIVKNAFKALDEAFAKAMMSEGTPEQATAHFAAQSELLYAVEEARKKNNLLDLLDPNSKNFILPGIMVRNQLSMTEQVRAMQNRLAPESALSIPQRNPGESIGEYQTRIAKDGGL